MSGNAAFEADRIAAKKHKNRKMKRQNKQDLQMRNQNPVFILSIFLRFLRFFAAPSLHFILRPSQ